MTEGRSEIRIGISACLLGEKVRFDGGHKREDYIVDVLGPFVAFVPVCPEVEIGLGTPRETIRLAGKPGAVRLVAPGSGLDHTSRMVEYAEAKAEELAGMDLTGYILKKDSPSCGMERVKVYDGNGVPAKWGRGLFAEVLLRRLPHLPVEEEGRLRDPRLRENFVERIFAYRRLRDLFGKPWKLGDLVRFHTAEKLLLLAHEPLAYTKLGRIVAAAKGMGRAEVAERYQEIFMEAFRKIATKSRHVNVLQHMAGYFRDLLGPEEKKELAETIDDFRRGLVPLIVPVTLIRHHVRRCCRMNFESICERRRAGCKERRRGDLTESIVEEERRSRRPTPPQSGRRFILQQRLRARGVAYLAGQLYLEPHPKELMLRNHV